MRTIPLPAADGAVTSQGTADELMSEFRTNGPPISVRPNSGTLLRLPRAARTVFIANEEIADVQVQTATPQYIFLSGKKPGATALYAADSNGEVLLSRLVKVEPGPTVIIHGSKLETGEPPPPPNFLVLPLQAAGAQPAAPAAR
jgi:Flp pilus assembly secretin CpaC